MNRVTFRRNKSTANKAMSELKSVPKSKSLSAPSSTEQKDEQFEPYAPNDDFSQFTLDEGLEILVRNEGSSDLEKGFSEKRVVLILRDYIHGKITLEPATRGIRDFVLDEDRVGPFGSCMLHTAMQIPYNHPGGQARLVQLLRNVYHYQSLERLDQFAMMIYENDEPDLEDHDDRSMPGDPLSLTVNFLGFLARLSQDGLFNMTSEGFQTMRRLESDSEDPQYADCYVRLAALWVIFAGQSLYTEVVEAPVVDPTERNDTGPLYKGPLFGRERWAFWRDTLMAADEKEGLSAESRSLAKKAAELMGAIERSVKF